MKLPHFIIEVANVHGGEKAKVIKLIKKFSKLDYHNLGIKFQPFKYNLIALSDYSWFETYKELFIKESDWLEIIDLAKENFSSIWLDLFDLYGVQILKKNIDRVFGIKLQASVLDNYEVYNALSSINLNKKRLMINISGYEIEEIERILGNYRKLNADELIIQIGYQAYPTKISDTALNKIFLLKEAFPSTRICFADHVSSEDTFSQRVPLVVVMAGCELIEKHICLNRAETKYDFFSALEYHEINNILKDIKNLIESHSNQFIPKAELDYLEKSIQQPVLRQNKKQGQLISHKEILFRRTKQKGISSEELFDMQVDFGILKQDINKNSTLNSKNFKKAKIAVIVACRMKSSRLKHKAILPINGIPSVERCLENCLMMPNVNEVILATSILKEDTILKNHTLNGKVKFWQGDPDDVIKRYIGTCEYYNIDVIIRVTADCPVISPEIAQHLLQAHFSNGADYTCANKHASGSASEIYNVESLKRVIHYLEKAEYSEYMTAYMQNNTDIFKVNVVDLPPQLVRPYRVTLDYQEDLVMFEKLYEKLEENGLNFFLENVFKILDQNPDIARINNHLTSRYQTDQELIDKLKKVTRITL